MISIFIVTLLVTFASSNFVPVPAYNLSDLAGTWYVQSSYDSTGNDWSMMYCLDLSFEVTSDSSATISYGFYQSFTNQFINNTVVLYPDSGNPAILYQDPDHQQPPLLVVNVSSLPYWSNNSTTTIILAVNYTQAGGNPSYLILGASRAYDTAYDIRPYLTENHFPITYSKNYWFVNSACDTHFNWTPLKNFNAMNLIRSWNLLAVYEPAGSGLVPWYTGGGIYDWAQAYCAKFTIIAGAYSSHQILLTLKNLYGGNFERDWLIGTNPNQSSEIVGFNIDGNTLLYVQYADPAGNMILTAGTTTSFFLSTSATTLTAPYKAIFEAALLTMGYKVDTSLINPIDGSSC